MKPTRIKLEPLLYNASNWSNSNPLLSMQQKIDLLAESIKKHGQLCPVETKDGFLVHGRVRCLALEKLGRKTVLAIELK